MAGGIDGGREAFDRQAWAEAFAHLSAAHAERALETEDLERLAVAAYLTGRDNDSVEAWTRAHQECAGRRSGAPLAARSGWRSVC